MTRRKIYVKGRPPAPDPDDTKKLLPGGGLITPPVEYKVDPAQGRDVTATARVRYGEAGDLTHIADEYGYSQDAAAVALSYLQSARPEREIRDRTFFTVTEVSWVRRPHEFARECRMRGVRYDTLDGTTSVLDTRVTVTEEVLENGAFPLQEALIVQLRRMLNVDVVFWKAEE